VVLRVPVFSVVGLVDVLVVVTVAPAVFVPAIAAAVLVAIAVPAFPAVAGPALLAALTEIKSRF
jgi:hypothetical protein